MRLRKQVITNEQDTNFVISADIGSDGKLALRQAISAGGTGVHGADRNKNALGPLFSAGSVQVSPAAKMLATVNSGSNTIALFSINEQDPAALTKVGSTVESGGDFPISVAFNSKGDTLCALNGGEANGIRCFKADKVNGLVPLAGTNRVLGINQTTPANGAPGTASHIIFSEDDKQLIASVKGIPDPKAADGRGTNGALAIWDVVNDGSLSAQFNIVAAPGKGLAPFGMAIVPNQKAVFAADPFIGFDVLDLNVQGGTNRSVDVTVDNQQTMGWVSRSPTTGNFFVSDGFTSHISEIKLGNDLRGVVVSDTDMADSGTHDNTIATVNGKDFLYVLSSKAMAIDVLAIDKNAKPAKLQRQDLATAVKAAQLSISPDNLSGLAAFVKA
ncbi:hypothetical protein L218DRAFT_886193 [Marasmius fiardii PR-910]|nr:hypothetical protein L218DRAFT_886193 [Marasmius fiardii PR-910]